MPRIEPIPWDELAPAQREAIEAGMASGAYTDPLPVQVLAYAAHDAVPDDGDRHPNFPRHLLGGKLLELLRIRSAQLGGCAPCMSSRKAQSATDEVVACLANPASSADLSPRERLALEYLELLATDHHRIDDETYARLAGHFTTAEIVELGMTCGGMIGMHRFMHTLDMHGASRPAIAYDPAQVGVAWSGLAPGRRADAA
jgi:alkylhydroperoxidase family enzyme